jgi:hypothetical protein
VLHRLCLLFALLPEGRSSSPCKASAAAATKTANLCACCTFEKKCCWACAHDKTSDLHSRKHETYTAHLCCSDKDKALPLYLFVQQAFFLKVFQSTSSLMLSKRSYIDKQETKTLFA